MKQFVCATSKSANVKLKVTYEPYERYSSNGIKIATVSGADVLDALKKMVDHMSLYIDSDQIEEENMSADDVIEEISYSNGDGCDFIHNITNLTTNEVLLDEGAAEEEDWDD